MNPDIANERQNGTFNPDGKLHRRLAHNENGDAFKTQNTADGVLCEI